MLSIAAVYIYFIVCFNFDTSTAVSIACIPLLLTSFYLKQYANFRTFFAPHLLVESSTMDSLWTVQVSCLSENDVESTQ